MTCDDMESNGMESNDMDSNGMESNDMENNDMSSNSDEMHTHGGLYGNGYRTSSGTFTDD